MLSKIPMGVLVGIVWLVMSAPLFAQSLAQYYLWPRASKGHDTIQERFQPPAGYQRSAMADGSFGHWLRNLPLKAGCPPVHLYNGGEKGRQDVHIAVVDIDVGTRNLQQCADALIRLRAEYLLGTGQDERIHFNFTSGDEASLAQWRRGYRPVIENNHVEWEKRAAEATGYANFRGYLEMVFIYAGTYSLERELATVKEPRDVRVGDVFIQGGFPGHAVLVVDVVKQLEGNGKAFLLAQSYMPAQEIHVLKNPNDNAMSPWYGADFEDVLKTPEWSFKRRDLKRFPDAP